MHFRSLITISLVSFLILNTVQAQRQKDIGILVLAHGGSETWNLMVDEATEPLRDEYPVSIAFGMANPKTLKKGISDLEKQNVRDIIVVPLFISSHSFIIRQTEYFLGLRNELVDPLILMDHSGGGNKSESHQHHQSNHMEDSPPQIMTSARIYMTRALDDHDIVAGILNKRIKSLSKDPVNESIVLVGHGPNPEEDNNHWLASMENLVAKIENSNREEGIAFKNIFAVTVRDDASREIYDLAKENLRSLVRQSARNSRVIVVPLLLSRGGIERGIVNRLEGLDYAWNGETLLPDPLITEFIRQSVELETRKKNFGLNK